MKKVMVGFFFLYSFSHIFAIEIGLQGYKSNGTIEDGGSIILEECTALLSNTIKDMVEEKDTMGRGEEKKEVGSKEYIFIIPIHNYSRSQLEKFGKILKEIVTIYKELANKAEDYRLLSADEIDDYENEYGYTSQKSITYELAQRLINLPEVEVAELLDMAIYLNVRFISNALALNFQQQAEEVLKENSSEVAPHKTSKLNILKEHLFATLPALGKIDGPINEQVVLDCLDRCDDSYGYDEHTLLSFLNHTPSSIVLEVSFYKNVPTFLFVGLSNGIIQVIDMESQKTHASLRGHKGRIASLNISSDGYYLYSRAYNEPDVVQWLIRTGQPEEKSHCFKFLKRYTYKKPEWDKAITTVIDSSDYTFAGFRNGTIIGRFQSTEECYDSTLEGHSEEITCLCVSPDRKFLISACKGGLIKVQSLRPFFVQRNQWASRIYETKVAEKLAAKRAMQDKEINELENTNLYSEENEGETSDSDKNSEDEEEDAYHDTLTFQGYYDITSLDMREIIKLELSPTGDFLFSVCKDGAIKVWNTATWEQCGVLAGHKGIKSSLVFSFNGEYLFSGAVGAKPKVWKKTLHQVGWTWEEDEDFIDGIHADLCLERDFFRETTDPKSNLELVLAIAEKNGLLERKEITQEAFSSGDEKYSALVTVKEQKKRQFNKQQRENYEMVGKWFIRDWYTAFRGRLFDNNISKFADNNPSLWERRVKEIKDQTKPNLALVDSSKTFDHVPLIAVSSVLGGGLLAAYKFKGSSATVQKIKSQIKKYSAPLAVVTAAAIGGGYYMFFVKQT